MAYTDKQIQCADCGTTFAFTASEQEFYASKGYTNEPKRCPSCRQARKSDRYGSDPGRPKRQMFSAVCAQCGKEAQVPFEPRSDRPVYCSDCYNKVRPNNRPESAS
jgi:CxxC-x17-CxxC domain-containing protein